MHFPFCFVCKVKIHTINAQVSSIILFRKGFDDVRKINWRQGNGAIVYGSFIMIAAVSLMLLTVERNHVYYASVYSQTRTDVIADGAAEYGQRAYGINPVETIVMANKINEMNNDLYGYDMKIEIDSDELIYKDNVKVTTTTTLHTLFTDKEKDVIRDATTHVVKDTSIGGDGIDYNAFPTDASRAVTPKYVSRTEDRRVTIINDIIAQFRLGINPRYTAKAGMDKNSTSQIFLWDYTVAMACEIPIKNDVGKILTATQIADWMMSTYGRSSGWQSVTAEEAQMAANSGKPAVAIRYERGRNGVAMVVRDDKAIFNEHRGVLIARAGEIATESKYMNDYLDSNKKIYFFVHE